MWTILSVVTAPNAALNCAIPARGRTGGSPATAWNKVFTLVPAAASAAAARGIVFFNWNALWVTRTVGEFPLSCIRSKIERRPSKPVVSCRSISERAPKASAKRMPASIAFRLEVSSPEVEKGVIATTSITASFKTVIPTVRDLPKARLLQRVRQ